jgi:hypothetical protein
MIQFKSLADEIEFFSPVEEINVKVELAGDEKIVIIDNFYKHPEKVRELALQIPASRSPTLLHALPGARVEATYHLGHFGHFITEIINKVYTEDASLIDNESIQYNLDRATFLVNIQNSNEALSKVQRPHQDHMLDARYAIGIYLNTPEECAGGTAFYKFKGEKTVDLENSTDPDLRGYNHYVQESDNLWEKLYLAEMKFNRLIIYKQNILHTPYIPADKYTVDNPRLVQMIFI